MGRDSKNHTPTLDIEPKLKSRLIRHNLTDKTANLYSPQ